MAYYTLLTRYETRWYPQFGAHDRETVEQERRDILNSPDPAEHISARDIRILETRTAHQRLVDQEIARLNRHNTTN